MIALAYPTMRVVAFGGAAKGNGAQLLAAGLASLAAGLVVYSAFLLFARAYYALGDSRTPALVALVSGLVGIAVMIGGGRAFHGAATVGMLGLGHSVAYLVGAVVLGIGLHRRTGAVWPHALIPAIVAITPFAVVAWWVGAEVEPQSRVLTALLVAGLSVVGRCGLPARGAAAAAPAAPAAPAGAAPATSNRPTRRSSRDARRAGSSVADRAGRRRGRPRRPRTRRRRPARRRRPRAARTSWCSSQLPNVSWADLLDAPATRRTWTLPRSRRRSAALSTRVRRTRATTLADGYATIGAGTRSVGDPRTDGDGLMTDERFGTTTRGRRVPPAHRARAVGPASSQPGLVPILDANARLHYDSEVGALADALRRTALRIGRA